MQCDVYKQNPKEKYDQLLLTIYQFVLKANIGGKFCHDCNTRIEEIKNFHGLLLVEKFILDKFIIVLKYNYILIPSFYVPVKQGNCPR